MSSPQAYVASSPIVAGHRKKSKFTFKQLNLLAQNSPQCALRCIALIDYDAFYAQCEQVRLGVPDDQPLAVQQWQGLIAINYPAREYGLTRHVTISEAKEKCPHIICQHVATWREGDDKWAYRENSANSISREKVSLDYYRLESRRSLALIKEILPASALVEKASIDEVFLDLSAQIHGVLLEEHTELRHAPYDDPSELLPLPSMSALNWEADGLIDLDDDQTEQHDPDWDDIIMNIGAGIVRDLRAKIREKLKYTCSAGIARNKVMAKLGAGYKKPNQQTIVRNRAVRQFLSAFKFTKIRNLGGKLGDQVVETFNTDDVDELLKVPIETLKAKLGDDTGTWLHNIIRGIDHSEVSSRTQIKSMLSAKSFRPSINSLDQALKWLNIFTADIYARLVEEGVVENKRRPKTMHLHHRQGGQMRSKSTQIAGGRQIDREILFELAKNLLQQVIVDGRAWPCANLSLSVGGFEDGVTGNKGIGSFLVRGDEARALETPSRSNTATPVQENPRPGKRRKLDDRSTIGRFFRSDSVPDDDEHASSEAEQTTIEPVPKDLEGGQHTAAVEREITTYLCTECRKEIDEVQRDEHNDWHFAKSLQVESRVSIEGPSNSRPPGVGHVKRGGTNKGRGRGGKSEKGQSRLTFG